MKLIKTLTIVAFFFLLGAGSLWAQGNEDLPSLEMPVLITPFGQSQDANFVNLLAKRIGMRSKYELSAFADDLDWSTIKSVIVVLGGSGKGLGAAGLDRESELKRCDQIIARAKEKGLSVIGMHIGGPDRRGPTSEIFLPYAANVNLMIVREDGNSDGFFTKLCAEKKVPLRIIKKTAEASGLLKVIYGMD